MSNLPPPPSSLPPPPGRPVPPGQPVPLPGQPSAPAPGPDRLPPPPGRPVAPVPGGRGPGGRGTGLWIGLGALVGVLAILVVGVVVVTLIDDDGAGSADRASTAVESTTTAGPTEETKPDITFDSEPTDTSVPVDTIDVFDLEVGDCFDVPDGTTVSDVDRVDCAAPHDEEMSARFFFTQPPGAPYPGDAAIDRISTRRCTGFRFRDYVGIAFDASELDAFGLTPSRASWEDTTDPDRLVQCVVASADGAKLTGSVQGSAR